MADASGLLAERERVQRVKAINRVSIAVWALAVLVIAGGLASAADPEFIILTPQDGSTIHPDPKRGPVVVVTYEVKHFKVVGFTELGPISEYEGHVHISLDEDPPSFTHTTSNVWVYNRVAPGGHRITLELVRRNHTPLKKPVKRTVRFTMAEK